MASRPGSHLAGKPAHVIRAYRALVEACRGFGVFEIKASPDAIEFIAGSVFAEVTPTAKGVEVALVAGGKTTHSLRRPSEIDESLRSLLEDAMSAAGEYEGPVV